MLGAELEKLGVLSFESQVPEPSLSLLMAITGVELLALTLIPMVGRFVLAVQKFSY
jgi:hypothetical protein